MLIIKEYQIKNFWENIKIGESINDCWSWNGNTINGYGFVNNNKNPKHILSHRLSWIIHCGEIPNNTCVLHKCNNKKCSNPKHLYLGTPKDNANDTRITNRINSNLKGKTNKLILYWINKENKQLSKI